MSRFRNEAEHSQDSGSAQSVLICEAAHDFYLSLDTFIGIVVQHV